MVDEVKDNTDQAAPALATTPVAAPAEPTSVPVATAPESPKDKAVTAAEPAPVKRSPGRPRKNADDAVSKAPVPVAKVAKPKVKVSDAGIRTASVKSAPPRMATAARTASSPKPQPVAKPSPAVTRRVPASPASRVSPAVTAPSYSAPASRKEPFKMDMNTNNPEFTGKLESAVKDATERTRAAFEKSQAAFGDVGEFAKGNVEAIVESTKILASGLQEMGKTYVSESKSVVEAMTVELKELASVKSPTEFFEKQAALLRKQFDAAVAASSKNSEAMLKLTNEAFQPISTRLSVAMEKMKVAA